ncbi:MAG: hypothetical protein ACRDPH_14035 [Marmoricola sp.]
MSGTGEDAVTPPPEVPEEFADAYRAAYQRALADQAHADESMRAEGRHGRHDARAGRHGLRTPHHARRAPRPRPARDAPAARRPAQGTPSRPWHERRWFVPVLLVLMALLLIAAAYGVGRLFAGGTGPGSHPASQAPVRIARAR